MNYYQFHIGDFRSGTVHMSRSARWIYRDMMDVYYDTERPLPADMDILCDMLGVDCPAERAIVDRHLRFKFDLTDDGYRHEVCDKVIAEYHAKADVARANGKLGGRPKGPKKEPSGFLSGSEVVSHGMQDESGSEANHKPITNNQEPDEIKSSCDRQAESPEPKARIPYADIFSAYAECLPGLPQLRIVDEARKTMIRLRWNSDKRFQSVDFWQRFFNHVSESDFLMGRTDKPWTGCCFDWLMKPANFRKIIEGNYTNA